MASAIARAAWCPLPRACRSKFKRASGRSADERCSQARELRCRGDRGRARRARRRCDRGRGRPVDAAARRECRPRRPGLARHRLDACDAARPARRRLLGRRRPRRGRAIERRRDHPARDRLESRPQSRDRPVGRRRLVLRQGAARHLGDRRAGAAVSDSGLDASGRDDRRRGADDAEILRPGAGRAAP